MANTTTSPNMNLAIPVVGTDPGPQYATDINNCLTIIDQHDHSTGSGVPVTPDGLNISSDLPMGSNNLTLTRSVRFTAQSAPLAGSNDLDCVYTSGVDLYYNDGNGNQVRITQSGGVAGSPGSIANLTSPASASYVSGNQTFVWQSDASTPANLDAASIILRNLTASSKGLTLAPPNAMASDYSITLPALPASTLPVSITSSGVMSAAQITLAQLVQALQDALNPAGSIISYGGSSAPSGYLLCDGAAVSRATYANLFTAIGTNYGSGDGTTTFNVPDARGMFLRGVTGASSNDPDASSRIANNSGGNTGNSVGSQQTSVVGPHTHQTLIWGIGMQVGGTQIFSQTHDLTFGSNQFASSIPITGGSTETRPLNLYVNFCIKT